MKIIFHINEQEKWSALISNANNLVSYSSETTEHISVEILANGFAVTDLTRQNATQAGIIDPLERLSKAGVSIFACRNSMMAHAIAEQDLCAFVGTVPSGVVELAVRQSQGYAYIKP